MAGSAYAVHEVTRLKAEAKSQPDTGVTQWHSPKGDRGSFGQVGRSLASSILDRQREAGLATEAQLVNFPG